MHQEQQYTHLTKGQQELVAAFLIAVAEHANAKARRRKISFAGHTMAGAGAGAASALLLPGTVGVAAGGTATAASVTSIAFGPLGLAGAAIGALIWFARS